MQDTTLLTITNEAAQNTTTQSDQQVITDLETLAQSEGFESWQARQDYWVDQRDIDEAARGQY
jgi:hypothetical protein